MNQPARVAAHRVETQCELQVAERKMASATSSFAPRSAEIVNAASEAKQS